MAHARRCITHVSAWKSLLMEPVHAARGRSTLGAMEELLALLETARAERAASLKDFVRLKAELARVQRRVDELRSENRELKVALHAAETEVVNLHAYLGEVAIAGEA